MNIYIPVTFCGKLNNAVLGKARLTYSTFVFLKSERRGNNSATTPERAPDTVAHYSTKVVFEGAF